jgi:hypothetical protein
VRGESEALLETCSRLLMLPEKDDERRVEITRGGAAGADTEPSSEPEVAEPTDFVSASSLDRLHGLMLGEPEM